MNQTNKDGFPARHYYRPTPARITQLPFIASARYASRHGRGLKSCLWLVNRHITDPDKATLIGREYAAHFAQFLKDNPTQAGSNLLGRIAAEIRYNDPTAASGYWIGFFSYLERLIAERAAQCVVFDELDRFNSSTTK